MDRPRFEALDVVRMLAAMVIVVHHARNPMGLHYGLVDPDMSLAVFVFFSLSAFLVFRPFVRGPVPVGAHLVRRLLRIYPAFLVALAVTLLLSRPYPAGHELQYLLMAQAPETIQPSGVMAVAWTLHVEVVFYLALPLLAAVMAVTCRDDQRRRLWLIGGVGIVSLVGYVLLDPTDGTAWTRTLIAPLMAWAFVPGMLAAWSLERSPRLAARLPRWRVLATGAAMLAIAFVLPLAGALRVVPMLLATTGMALMIPGLLASGPLPRPLGLVATAGRTLSYPTYLWHIVVIVMVAAAGLSGWLGVGVALAVTLLMSAGSWLLIERPAMKLSGWLTTRIPTKDGTAVPASVAPTTR
jgi:peptidoglycan/LPS O-acetylase OafA/YrhL